VKSYDKAPAGAVDRARRLRRNATEAEKLLWRELRRCFPNAKFRRQSPLGPYICDFLCFRHKLVIEVDGGQHAVAAMHDARRTAYLENEGYRVLRFWNGDVFGNIDGVLASIAEQIGAE